MRPADTSPKAWKIFLDCQRRLTPSERLGRAYELSRMLRHLNEAGIQRRHPEMNPRQVFLSATRQILGPDLFRRVYGEPAEE